MQAFMKIYNYNFFFCKLCSHYTYNNIITKKYYNIEVVLLILIMPQFKTTEILREIGIMSTLHFAK